MWADPHTGFTLHTRHRQNQEGVRILLQTSRGAHQRTQATLIAALSPLRSSEPIERTFFEGRLATTQAPQCRKELLLPIGDTGFSWRMEGVNPRVRLPSDGFTRFGRRLKGLCPSMGKQRMQQKGTTAMLHFRVPRFLRHR